MAFDSLTLASAASLFAASIGAWVLAAPMRAAARLYLRFAAMLMAALIRLVQDRADPTMSTR